MLSDGRKSFAKIARECNLSTASISDRFAELEKMGAITGSTIQVNYKALGYNAVCDVSIRASSQVEQVIIYIQKIPYTILALGQDATNGIYLIVGLKELNEIDKLKEIIRKNRFVLDVKVENWIGIKNIPENLEILPNARNISKNLVPVPMSTHSIKTQLEELDFQIIEKLSTDSRQPFSKIAKEIGTSTNTVARKYQKLTENKVIRSLIQINPLKLGYSAMMRCSLTFSSLSNTESVIDQVMKIKDNYLVIKLSGEYDLYAFFYLRDINQLLNTQNEIAKTPSLSRISYLTFPAPVQMPIPREYISTF